MWDLDIYDLELFDEWLDSISVEDRMMVATTLESMTQSADHPWFFGSNGAEGAKVFKMTSFGAMIYKAHLDSRHGEIALIFAVNQWHSDGSNLINGEILLLLHDRLKNLRKRYSIEAVAYKLLGEKSWQK